MTKTIADPAHIQRKTANWMTRIVFKWLLLLGVSIFYPSGNSGRITPKAGKQLSYMKEGGFLGGIAGCGEPFSLMHSSNLLFSHCFRTISDLDRHLFLAIAQQYVPVSPLQLRSKVAHLLLSWPQSFDMSSPIAAPNPPRAPPNAMPIGGDPIPVMPPATPLPTAQRALIKPNLLQMKFAQV